MICDRVLGSWIQFGGVVHTVFWVMMPFEMRAVVVTKPISRDSDIFPVTELWEDGVGRSKGG